MVTAGDRPHWEGSANPFPAAAVARVYGPYSDSGRITVRTDAVEAVERFVDGYLSDTAAPPDAGSLGEHLAGKGRVCVIQGNYGTGKTHLALELLSRMEQAWRRNEVEARVAYEAVPDGGFLELYTRVLDQHMGETELSERVKEWYADLVAESLRERPYAASLAARVQRDDVDPQVVVERYGLKEGVFRADLRKRLASITPDETYSRALMLLLQADLRPLAWKWLTGGDPDPALAARGITRRISTDVQAMEALGVVARLYGRRDRRFVLVIDEVEKISKNWEDRNAAHAQAFKRLLEVFHEAGALLAVCGLPEIFDLLLQDRGRVATTIRLPRLCEEDVRSYIRESQYRAFGRRALRPFTGESIRYIISFTRGTAREVVRVCHLAFARAAETGREITPALVRDAIRDELPGGDADGMRRDIEGILSDEGWLPGHYRIPEAPPGLAIDFWIPGAAEGAGCAVCVSDPVLERGPAAALAEAVSGFLAGLGGAEGARGRIVILVVAGYLPTEQRDTLTEAVGEQFLIGYSDQFLIGYQARTFRADFSRAIGTAMERLGRVRSGAPVELGAELERITRQQAETLRVLRELQARTDVLAAAADDSRNHPPGNGEHETALPPALERLFDKARESIRAYGDVRHFLDRTFEITSRAPGERFPLAQRFRPGDAFTPLGIAAYLEDLLASFRSSIQSWLAEAVRPPAAMTDRERLLLREICLTYESMYGVSQAFKMDPMPERLWLEGGGSEPPPRSVRRQALEEVLGSLGNRVFRTALEAAGADPGDL